MKENRVGLLKKFVVVALVCNFLVLGSAWIKPLRVPLYAEGEIDAGNTKSIFINTAFVVMGALGLKIVASANGLASDFANSLGDLYDSWVTAGSIATSAITSALQTKLTVQNQTLNIGGTLYNQIINFLNYCGGAVSSGITSIFNTPTPAFSYDTPGNYLPVPLTTTRVVTNSNDGTNIFTVTGISSSVRLVFLTATYNYYAYFVGLSSGLSVGFQSYSNPYRTVNLNSTKTVNGITYYYYYYSISKSNNCSFDFPILSDLSDSINNAIYLTFGAGAVAGTDGTISIPDPISRNYNDVNSKPFTGVGENDDVPIAIPGSFATDYPLTGTWDIPDSLPFAIPWVLDVPSALDTPIDIPWYPDPIGNIPAPTIPAPPSLTDVPLIINPECESLSACLIQGVSTVSNHISQFINIHEEFRNYTIITLLIGFALFILGVFA